MSDIDKIARILTGGIAANCCHVTGGLGRDDDKYCECREMAKEIVAITSAEIERLRAALREIAALPAERSHWRVKKIAEAAIAGKEET